MKVPILYHKTSKTQLKEIFFSIFFFSSLFFPEFMIHFRHNAGLFIMTKNIMILFTAVLLGISAAACIGRTCVVIPESGENASHFQTRSDGSGRILLDLSGNVEEVRYRHFSIRNPHDPRFAVPVAENTPDLAQWRLAVPSRRFYFQGKVARDRLPFAVRDNGGLRENYERIYKNDPLVIRFRVGTIERDGQSVVSFETRTRRPDGLLILTSGFASLDPADADFIIEACCTVSAYDEKEFDAPEIRNLDRIFLDSVRLAVPE